MWSQYSRCETCHRLRLPRNPDDYVQRVGRTAHAGGGDEAITMMGQRDVALFLAIEVRVGQKMCAFDEKGVNIDTRIIRDGLEEVGEREREAMLAIEGEGSRTT